MLIPIPNVDSNYRTEKYRLPKSNTAQHYSAYAFENLSNIQMHLCQLLRHKIFNCSGGVIVKETIAI